MDGSVGPYGPIGRSGQPPLAPGQIDVALHALTVVWMHAPDHILGRWRDRIGLEAEQAPHVGRPQQNVCLEVPLPRAGLRELLGSFERPVLGAHEIDAQPAREVAFATALASWAL